jgi:DNA invertase Pin-like site-specific DNA recombinase
MVVGYKRVSALDQADLRQLDGVETDKLVKGKASGKDTSRPQLTAMLSFVRESDTNVCHAMDRLTRNLDDLRRLVLALVKRGVDVRCVKENLTFTGEASPMAHLLLSVIGALRPV